MSYLLDHLPSLRAELVLRLGDALDAVPAVAAGALDREQLVDVIVRLFVASWIIPESDDARLVQSANRILQIPSGSTSRPGDTMESDMETETETDRRRCPSGRTPCPPWIRRWPRIPSPCSSFCVTTRP